MAAEGTPHTAKPAIDARKKSYDAMEYAEIHSRGREKESSVRDWENQMQDY